MNDCLNTSCVCPFMRNIGLARSVDMIIMVFFYAKEIHSDGGHDDNGIDDDDEEGSQPVVVSGYWCTKLW